ncbi:MAG: hypothetical protein KF713_20460 [Turneriella sp.]|nr:hypothetical protein [Turneriella sp.]
MAKKLLKNVEAPADLRDIILEEYERYKNYRGAGAPDALFSTFAAATGTGVPSHDAGKAIDIVTDGYDTRPYLFEFGIWLFVKRPELSVYFYSMQYEPHVHVGQVSGFGKGSYLAVNKGAKGKFDIYPRAQVAAKASSIIDKLKKARETYPPGVSVDWSTYQGMLEGRMPAGASRWKDYLRRYWWVGALSVLALVIGFFIWRSRNQEEPDDATA